MNKHRCPICKQPVKKHTGRRTSKRKLMMYGIKFTTRRMMDSKDCNVHKICYNRLTHNR